MNVTWDNQNHLPATSVVIRPFDGFQIFNRHFPNGLAVIGCLCYPERPLKADSFFTTTGKAQRRHQDWVLTDDSHPEYDVWSLTTDYLQVITVKGQVPHVDPNDPYSSTTAWPMMEIVHE